MTATTIDPEVLSRVRAGITWLDANIPDWLGRIDLEKLNLRSHCDCILGQLDGDFYASAAKRSIFFGAEELGFMYVSARDRRRLGFAWPIEIERLRAERGVPE